MDAKERFIIVGRLYDEFKVKIEPPCLYLVSDSGIEKIWNEFTQQGRPSEALIECTYNGGEVTSIKIIRTFI